MKSNCHEILEYRMRIYIKLSIFNRHHNYKIKNIKYTKYIINTKNTILIIVEYIHIYYGTV